MSTTGAMDHSAAIPTPTRFIAPDSTPALFHFTPHMARVAAEPNRRDNQSLINAFERAWGRVRLH